MQPYEGGENRRFGMLMPDAGDSRAKAQSRSYGNSGIFLTAWLFLSFLIEILFPLRLCGFARKNLQSNSDYDIAIGNFIRLATKYWQTFVPFYSQKLVFIVSVKRQLRPRY